MKALNRLYRAFIASFCCAAAFAGVATAAGTAEAALAYLEVEVPKWKRANGCYSCHNNGDGLRALIAARRAGLTVNAEALAVSLAALSDPAAWEAKPLARLHFAGTALDAFSAGLIKRDALEAAAAAVAQDQSADGHWKVDEELSEGSPVTYGPVLATWMARRVLDGSAELRQRYQAAIEKANVWLASRKASHPLDLAALVLALGRDPDRNKLVAAQLANGSWNNEPFDTAMAMLALRRTEPEATARARAWLAKRQLPGGGWPGTTRPAGGESYAQHISTTAWALIALLPAPDAR